MACTPDFATTVTSATNLPPRETAMSSTLTHISSRRVTAGISFHSFEETFPSTSSPSTSTCERRPRPTQNVTLQFPPDLDPAGGRHGLRDDERRCTFTPCQTREGSLSILTRNGRITGLLGLPRPYQTLTADVVEVGGGFSEEALTKSTLCIAGGTGLAPFLTMTDTSSKTLCWSIRSDDFGAAEFVLRENLLKPNEWKSVSIFVTSGEDAGGLVEKPLLWWSETFSTLTATYPGISLSKRRMSVEDMTLDETQEPTILFCGSKSLEWQIRMWTMGQATVHRTDVV